MSLIFPLIKDEIVIKYYVTYPEMMGSLKVMRYDTNNRADAMYFAAQKRKEWGELVFCHQETITTEHTLIGF